MMKARLVPIYLTSAEDEEFQGQLRTLKNLLSEEAEFLKPIPVGSPLPEAEAVIFPQLVGEAYRQIAKLKTIKLPLLAITSEFGTVAMWDWEIVSFLRSQGLETFAPYNLALSKKICRCLALKREMKETKFLVFQDNPGEGMQASIFKRFYWWEDQCTQGIIEKFGITITRKSFEKLADAAKKIPEQEAETAWENWGLKTEDVSQRALHGAIRIYLAVKREIEKDQSIRGVGMNCLNESFFSDTTPCLAWNMLFEEKGILWACEADTMSLLTEYIIHRPLDAPLMTSNIYPFLMGQAALKHEKIPAFPEVDEPENHILVAHCGYLGVLPKPYSTEWQLRPKVLAIVDDNATAIDARLPVGNVTLAKLDPTLSKIMVVEGYLEGYAQYPGSDCRNGAVIRVPDGRKLVNSVYSHHQVFVAGHLGADIEMVANILDLTIERV